MILQIIYIKKQYPYHDKSLSGNDFWAHISIELVDNSKSKKIILEAADWQVSNLIDWFNQNEKLFIQEIFPLDCSSISSSIAKCIQLFYDNLDIENDSLIDALYEYRARHDLSFPMRGCKDFKSIIIGIVNEELTVSCFSQNESWDYIITDIILKEGR
jgi:hypothetical protein